jgi:phosphoglycolate phosphatase
MERFSVLFDLDGTLTDPKPGITRCIAYAVDKLGLPEVDPDDLGWCIGPPLRGSFGKVLGTSDPEVIARAIGYYRERFGDVGLFENEVYDGIPAVLATLQSQNYRLFVATSKPEPYAIRIVERFGLSPYFERVVGSEMDGTREPKAEVIAHVIDQCGVKPSLAVMIGDRMHDVLGAKEHGMPCIGVLYGFAEGNELAEAGAWPLCEVPEQITPAVSTIRSQA